MLPQARESFTFDDFSLGLDWFTNPFQLDKRSLLDAKNCSLNKFRGIDKRDGIAKWSTTSPGTADIKTLYEYNAPNGTDYILAANSTVVEYSTGTTWSDLKTGLTSGKKFSFATHQGILYGGNGTDDNFKAYNTTSYQVGITPPATNPTVAAIDSVYQIEEDCAAIGDWNDGDNANGASTQVTFDGKSCFRFLNGGGAGDLASRNRYPSVKRVTAQLFVEANVYMNTLGSSADSDFFYMAVDTGYGTTGIAIDAAEFFVINGTAWDGDFIQTGVAPTMDTWINVKFTYDARDPANRTLDLYIDDVHAGQWTIDNSDGATPGLYTIGAYGVTVATDCYLDSFTAEHVDIAGTRSYRYVYCYKRSTASGLPELISNPSSASVTVDMASGGVSVSYTASADAQVDKILIYRTLDFALGGTPTTVYYLVAEVNNATSSYTDTTDDDDLTTLCETDNTVPPKAYFIKLHADRVFYANCPDETDGESMVMWSKIGKGEAVPSSNYQYFDRADGHDITGIASLTDYLLVFKKNKIGILEGEFEELYYISLGVGCIAPWAILELSDQVVFLSEEGWKATDGRTIWDISERVNTLAERGYFSYDERENYSVAYYPEKNQFYFLMNHSSLNKIVMVGHFVIPLLMQHGEVPESTTGPAIAWTYHEYDNHTLTVLGNYTDSDGIQRIMAGIGTTGDRYVWKLDSGTADDSSNIAVSIKTGWMTLGTPASHVKVIRAGEIVYGTSATGTINFNIDIDSVDSVDTNVLTGSAASGSAAYPGDIYTGTYAMNNETIDLKGTGKYYRFNVTETSTKRFMYIGSIIHYRVEGVRA
jgi:hypothetical protein